MLTLIFVIALSTAVDPDPFLVKPYLQLGDAPKLSGSESLVLLWHAAASGPAAAWKVEVQSAKQWRAMSAPASERIEIPGIEPHLVYRATLSKLAPGGEFRYRVSKAGAVVFEATARARKSARQAQHFVVFGDIAQGNPSQRALAHQVAMAKPDFVAVMGDIVYGAGRISEYREKYFPVYNGEEASAATGAPLLRSVPFIAAPGNHDVALKNLEKFPDALAYFYYWDQPMNGPKPSGERTTHSLLGTPEVQAAFKAAAKHRYPGMANFSFDYGNAHWTMLDSNPYMDWTNPALQQWLKADLAGAQKARWRFVGFHHPGFNSSKSHLLDQWMRLLAPVFEQGKVDVVFGGHVHNYQRSYPLTFVAAPQPDGKMVGPKGEVAGTWTLDKNFGSGGRKPKGVIYVITGGGGAGLYNPEQQADPTTWQPFTQKYFAERRSFSLVDIDGGTFRLRQISEDGKEMDAFTLVK